MMENVLVPKRIIILTSLLPPKPKPATPEREADEDDLVLPDVLERPYLTYRLGVNSGLLHQCRLCPYSSTKKQKIVCHARTHTGEKPYQCRYCPYAAARMSQLTVHQRRHTGEKPYKCFECDYACTNKGDLVKHERLHRGERPFKCQYCDYRAAQSYNVRSHEMCHAK